MTYKKGDKVRVKDKFWELDNPRDYITDDKNKRSLVGKILEVKEVFSSGCVDTKSGTIPGIETGWSWNQSWLEPAHREIDDVQEDDLVTNGTLFGRVLGRSGKVVHLSCYWEKGEQGDLIYGSSWSTNQLKNDNWSIVQDTTTEDIIELTLDDVAKLKGIDVKKLRIKD